MFKKRTKQAEHPKPEKPKNIKKSARPKQVLARLSIAEFEAMKQRVNQSGLPQADFLRRCILNARIVPLESLIALNSELKHISNNLNQIARRINSNEEDLAEEIKNATETLVETLKLVRGFVEEESSSTDNELRFIASQIQQYLAQQGG
jgi:chaperone required for assembly of F1-ATPase